MANPSKIEKTIAYLAARVVGSVRAGWGSRIMLVFYRRWGMRLDGRPSYISPRSDLDGTDWSLIHLGEGVTISSYVRVLTHDWCAHTVAKAVDIYSDKALGRIEGVSIGAYSFIGTGSVVMPGTKIGRGCIVGAGTVVRGTIPDFSIVLGSPGKVVGDSRSYLRKLSGRYGWELNVPVESELM